MKLVLFDSIWYALIALAVGLVIPGILLVSVHPIGAIMITISLGIFTAQAIYILKWTHKKNAIPQLKATVNPMKKHEFNPSKRGEDEDSES